MFTFVHPRVDRNLPMSHSSVDWSFNGMLNSSMNLVNDMSSSGSPGTSHFHQLRIGTFLNKKILINFVPSYI
jgi:hypothetical protein